MTAIFTLVLLLLFSIQAAAFQPHILFDQGHGQAFLIEQNGDLDLSQLADSLDEQGYKVSSTAQPLTSELLSHTTALVISGAFKAFSQEEIANIRQFIERGGHLAVMIHIGPPLLPLLLAHGVDIANGVIHEQQQLIDNQALNFRTSRLQSHPLTESLDSFSLYGSWPVRTLTADGQTLAFSSDDSWVDLNGDRQLSAGDAQQSFGVLVANQIGQGELLVFGDDALFQNRFLTGDNQQLANNLGRWLAAGYGAID